MLKCVMKEKDDTLAIMEKQRLLVIRGTEVGPNFEGFFRKVLDGRTSGPFGQDMPVQRSGGENGTRGRSVSEPRKCEQILFFGHRNQSRKNLFEKLTFYRSDIKVDQRYAQCRKDKRSNCIGREKHSPETMVNQN